MSVLRDRYASAEMTAIWAAESKILLERKLWINVMKSQAKLGLSISPKVLADYERVLSVIDIKSIDSREKKLHHDVKARIEEFNSLAGHEYIHLGMTSRDLTENIEMYQARKSLEIVKFKSIALLFVLGKLAEKYSDLAMVGRTHNVPAQVTTLGRRFSAWAEELLFAHSHLENLISRLPIRGIKGAIGNSSDMTELVGDSVPDIDRELAKELGFNEVLESPTQIYPRSIDFEIVSTLLQIASAPETIAINIRLMSGFGLISESFQKGQTGSSAMPHKINPRLSERINSLTHVLRGCVTVISGITGQQWNEGDVSCSAARRVALPDSFYTIDAILDTAISVLKSLVIHEDEISKELERFLPEMMSSRILMLATKEGMGREEAHRLIKGHVFDSQAEYKETGISTFITRVKADKNLKLTVNSLDDLMAEPLGLTGMSHQQIKKIQSRITDLAKSLPEIADYQPAEIL